MTDPRKKMKPSTTSPVKEALKKEVRKPMFKKGTSSLKYPDGTNKARVQEAKGTATDKGRNQGGVPANSELGKKLKARDEAATKRYNAMSEEERKKAMNRTTKATTQATIDATGTAKSTNKKLETYTDKTAKTKEAAKKAEASKYDKSSALKSIKAKGSKMMKLRKK